jgi:hypothetical protein
MRGVEKSESIDATEADRAGESMAGRQQSLRRNIYLQKK